MVRRLNENQKRTIANWGMEFVVVVVGVLLALWLQEKSSAAGKQRDAAAAEAAIRDELDDNLMILVAQDMIADCQNDRLREIENRLKGSGRAAPITGNTFMEPRDSRRRNSVYESFALNVSDTAWQSALANGSLSNIPGDRYRKLANLHAEFQAVEQRLESSSDAAKDLQVLSYGTDLTPDLRAQLLRSFTIASGNRAYFSEALPAAAVAEEMGALGWTDKSRIDAKIREFQQGMKAYGFTPKPCTTGFRNPFASE